MKLKNIVLITTILITLSVSANASTFEGNISQVIFGTGQSPVRVSIYVQGHTSTPCVANYFAYENADTGLAKLWTSASLTAYASQKTVTIVGNGICDIYGIEGITTIVVK